MSGSIPSTIVGKSFFKSLQCVYDSLGGVLKTRLLDVAPFPVTDMFPQHYLTEEKAGDVAVDKQYTAIVDKLSSYDQILPMCPMDGAMVASLAQGGGNTSVNSLSDSTDDGFDTGIIPDSLTISNYGRARKRRNQRTRFIEPSPESCLLDDESNEE
eukprot:scaffold3976_cov45-Cyclotella_meneghiniana.AAC.3